MRQLFRALACIGGAAAMIAPAAAAQAQTRAPLDTEECKVSVTRLVATKTSIRAAVERTGCEEPTILRAEIRIERFGPDKVVKRAKRVVRGDGRLSTSTRCSFRPRSYYVFVTDSDGNTFKSDTVRLRCGSRFGFDRNRGGSHGNGQGNGHGNGQGNVGNSGDQGNSGNQGGSNNQGSVGTAAEQEVIRLTNEHRKAAGCAPLIADANLRTAALTHSQKMAAANNMQHQLPGEPGLLERIKAAGFSPVTAAAENIAAGHPTPSAVVNAWMNSSGHRANILNCNLTHIGVGVAQGSGKLFWTQNFARH